MTINAKNPLVPRTRCQPKIKFAMLLLCTVVINPLGHTLEIRGFENARFAWDFSSRLVHSGGTNWTQHALGLDLHNVISGRSGDIGTLRLQPYLVRIDGPPTAPPLFEDRHDHELQWRFADFNYTGIGHGRFNIRVGHFELPFGIENAVQTNGTLYQTNLGRTFGFKGDWGASINGTLPQLVYEIAVMDGGGNELADRASGYMVGRVASPSDQPWWVGFSFLNGELEQRTRLANEPIQVNDVEMYAFDLGARLPSGFMLTAELSQGQRNDQDMTSWFFDLGWFNRSESTFVYTQWRSQDIHTQDNESMTFGLRYEPSARWSASFEAGRNFEPFVDEFVSGQLRVRW